MKVAGGRGEYKKLSGKKREEKKNIVVRAVEGLREGHHHTNRNKMGDFISLIKSKHFIKDCLK